MTKRVEQEFSTADLGDERLNQRLAKVVDTLSRQPGKSITLLAVTGAKPKPPVAC
jgi:hypothetical protein